MNIQLAYQVSVCLIHFSYYQRYNYDPWPLYYEFLLEKMYKTIYGSELSTLFAHFIADMGHKVILHEYFKSKFIKYYSSQPQFLGFFLFIGDQCGADNYSSFVAVLKQLFHIN